MNPQKSFFSKVHAVVDILFVVGILLILVGAFLHPSDWPAVLMRTLIDLGAGIAIAGVIAHFLA